VLISSFLFLHNRVQFHIYQNKHISWYFLLQYLLFNHHTSRVLQKSWKKCCLIATNTTSHFVQLILICRIKPIYMVYTVYKLYMVHPPSMIYIIENFFLMLISFSGYCESEMTYSYNNSQRDALFLKFILIKDSTCVRQIYCPSSGVSTMYSQL